MTGAARSAACFRAFHGFTASVGTSPAGIPQLLQGGKEPKGCPVLRAQLPAHSRGEALLGLPQCQAMGAAAPASLRGREITLQRGKALGEVRHTWQWVLPSTQTLLPPPRHHLRPHVCTDPPAITTSLDPTSHSAPGASRGWNGRDSASPRCPSPGSCWHWPELAALCPQQSSG